MLLSIFDIFFSCLIFTFLFLKPLSEKVRLRHYGILFIILFLLESPQLFKLTPPTIFVLGAAFFYMLFLTKNKLLNSILALFTYFTVVVCSNGCILLLQNLFHKDMKIITASLFYSLIYYICFSAFVFALTSLIGWYAKKHLQPDNFLPYHKLFFLILIEIFSAIAILIFNIDYGMKIGYPDSTIVYNCILFFLYFLFSTLLLINVVKTTRKNMEAEQRELEYQQLTEYIKDLEQTAASLRKFQHDYLNILLSMDLMIHTGDLDRLTAYFDQHIKPEGRKVANVNICITNLFYITEPAVKGIISHKLQMARLRGISVRVEAIEEIKNFYMEPFDLARIMGFFLDNAMEAAEPEGTPFIHVSFTVMPDYLIIIVENSCSSEELSMNLLTQEGFSTKGKNRGHGLRRVEEILARYPFVLHSMQKTDNIFTQTLELHSDLTE